MKKIKYKEIKDLLNKNSLEAISNISDDEIFLSIKTILNASDKDGVNSAMTDVFGVAGTGIELIPPRQFILRVRKSY